jgi:hypothetical protein
VGFNFHVPFQSGEGTRQPDVATNAHNTTQPNLAFLIDFAPRSRQATMIFRIFQSLSEMNCPETLYKINWARY